MPKKNHGMAAFEDKDRRRMRREYHNKKDLRKAKTSEDFEDQDFYREGD